MPKIQCSCGAVLSYKREQAGRRARCPACSAELTLPMVTPSADEAAARPPRADSATGEAPAESAPSATATHGASSGQTGFRLRDDDMSHPPQPTQPAPPYETRTAEPAFAQATSEREAVPQDERPDFWRVLPMALTYPLNKEALPLLLCGVIAFTVVIWLAGFLNWLPLPYLGFILQIVVLVILAGFLAGYLMELIAKSAEGEDDPPDWPEPGDYREEAVEPIGYFLAVGILSFGGAVAYYYACHREPDALIFFLLRAFGCLYMPMGILVVAVYRDVTSLNPWYVIKAISQVPVRYMAVWAFIVAAMQVMMLGLEFATRAIPYDVLRNAVGFAVLFYFLFAMARALGLLYYTSWDRLKWLAQ